MNEVKILEETFSVQLVSYDDLNRCQGYVDVWRPRKKIIVQENEDPATIVDGMKESFLGESFTISQITKINGLKYEIKGYYQTEDGSSKYTLEAEVDFEKPFFLADTKNFMRYAGDNVIFSGEEVTESYMFVDTSSWDLSDIPEVQE